MHSILCWLLVLFCIGCNANYEASLDPDLHSNLTQMDCTLSTRLDITALSDSLIDEMLEENTTNALLFWMHSRIFSLIDSSFVYDIDAYTADLWNEYYLNLIHIASTNDTQSDSNIAFSMQICVSQTEIQQIIQTVLENDGDEIAAYLRYQLSSKLDTSVHSEHGTLSVTISVLPFPISTTDTILLAAATVTSTTATIPDTTSTSISLSPTNSALSNWLNQEQMIYIGIIALCVMMMALISTICCVLYIKQNTDKKLENALKDIKQQQERNKLKDSNHRNDHRHDEGSLQLSRNKGDALSVYTIDPRAIPSQRMSPQDLLRVDHGLNRENVLTDDEDMASICNMQRNAMRYMPRNDQLDGSLDDIDSDAASTDIEAEYKPQLRKYRAIQRMEKRGKKRSHSKPHLAHMYKSKPAFLKHGSQPNLYNKRKSARAGNHSSLSLQPAHVNSMNAVNNSRPFHIYSAVPSQSSQRSNAASPQQQQPQPHAYSANNMHALKTRSQRRHRHRKKNQSVSYAFSPQQVQQHHANHSYVAGMPAANSLEFSSAMQIDPPIPDPQIVANNHASSVSESESSQEIGCHTPTTGGGPSSFHTHTPGAHAFSVKGKSMDPDADSVIEHVHVHVDDNASVSTFQSDDDDVMQLKQRAANVYKLVDAENKKQTVTLTQKIPSNCMLDHIDIPPPPPPPPPLQAMDEVLKYDRNVSRDLEMKQNGKSDDDLSSVVCKMDVARPHRRHLSLQHSVAAKINIQL